MKTEAKRFQEVITAFPALEAILKELDIASIPYAVGGSVALYVQGCNRKPKDVDIMFTDDAFNRANRLFNLEPRHIERPYNSMNKSTPVDGGSIEFLNRYASKIGKQSYGSPPAETVAVPFKNMVIKLIRAEKIAVYKLISRREHHDDLKDFNELFHHPDFDTTIFWKIVDSFGARETVVKLLGSQPEPQL